MKNKEKARILYLWISLGLIFSIAFGAMSAGKGYNPKQLLNHGSLYEFSRASLESETKNCVYDKATGKFTIISDFAKKKFSKIPMKNWKFIELYINNMNVAGSSWNILYLDENKKVISEQSAWILNGRNTIEVSCQEEFRYIHIQILNQPGLEFSLKKIQVHTGKIVEFSEWVQQFIAYFMLYILFSIIMYIIIAKDIYVFVNFLQYLFIRIGNWGGRKTGKVFDTVKKTHLKTFLFMILFGGMIVANAMGIYDTPDGYRYCLIFLMAVFLILVFLWWEKPFVTVKWKGNIAFFWFFYWIFVCVMDFFMDKQFRYTGYVCLFGMTFFLFAVQQCAKPKLLWNHIYQALIGIFPVVTAFCMCFRGKRTGVLYNGAFTTREDMALYSVTMLGVFLAVICRKMFDSCEPWTKKDTLHTCFMFSGAVICGLYLYLSWTLMCILTGGILVLSFLVYMFVNRKKLIPNKIQGLLCFGSSLVVSITVVFLVFMSIAYIPQNLGTNLMFEREIQESYVPEEEMKLQEQIRPGLYDGVRCIAKAEKKLVWKSYLREIDFMGNGKMLLVAQHETMANSGWLELIYRYGVFCLMPILGLWIFVLEKTVGERKWAIGFLFLNYHILFLTQNIEKPFLQPLWILVYLGIGTLINDTIFNKLKKN